MLFIQYFLDTDAFEACFRFSSCDVICCDDRGQQSSPTSPASVWWGWQC